MSLGAVDDAVAAGHDALRRGEWGLARTHFETALGLESSGEAWEGLGWTGWWLHDGELTIRAREAAYAAYREAGDAAGAARVAVWLASDHREHRGDAAVGRGWLVRARRLLEDLDERPEHGWLALHSGSFALGEGEAQEACRLALDAHELGRRLGVAGLEAVGLGQEGAARIVLGEVELGMQRLEEAAAVLRGEAFDEPLAPGWTLCYLVGACEGVGDFPRAASWCESMRDFAERWHGRQLLGICRTTYGHVLITRGDWRAAESELSGAVGDLVASRRGVAGTGFVRLAQLRVRQGRIDEARELYAQAGPHPEAIVGLGELALDAGDALIAREAADRVLRRLPGATLLDRLPALELRARALAAQGDPEAAEAVAELRATADRYGTPYLHGRGARVAAEVALAAGEAERARCEAEDAVDAFATASAPYDGARSRLLLAAALDALGRPEHAAAEREAARAALERLGAAPAAGGAAAPVTEELTARELEVLRLVARGLSDAQVAAALVVSPHTVHRHMANVRTKLRLPSRAAAVAHATRAGLL